MKVSKTQYLTNAVLKQFMEKGYAVGEFIDTNNKDKQAVLINSSSTGLSTKGGVFEEILISMQIIVPQSKRFEVESDLVSIKNNLRAYNMSSKKTNERMFVEKDTRMINGVVNFYFTR